MKKSVLTSSLLLLIVAILSIQSFAAPIEVQLDGKMVNLSTEPISVSGRTMLPMRELFELFGMDVSWEQSTKTVTATSEKNTIALTIGSNQATVNGTLLNLDVPATIRNGRTLVPLRFVAESLQAGVAWDSVNRKVIINRDGTVAEVPKAGNYEATVYPAVSPNTHPEYIDRAATTEIYWKGGIDIFPEKGGMAGIRHPGILIDPKGYDGEAIMNVGTLVRIYGKMLELNPNSDLRNIPNDIKPGSEYYQDFQKVMKTGIFQFMVDDQGNIHPERQLLRYEALVAFANYWEYVGFDPDTMGHGYLEYMYGPQRKVRKTSIDNYSSQWYYAKIKPIFEVGFGHGFRIFKNSEFSEIPDLNAPAKYSEVARFLAIVTGRDGWKFTPEFNQNMVTKKGYKMNRDESSVLQSQPASFIN